MREGGIRLGKGKVAILRLFDIKTQNALSVQVSCTSAYNRPLFSNFLSCKLPLTVKHILLDCADVPLRTYTLTPNAGLRPNNMRQ